VLPASGEGLLEADATPAAAGLPDDGAAPLFAFPQAISANDKTTHSAKAEIFLILFLTPYLYRRSGVLTKAKRVITILSQLTFRAES
jgi:hypothetical protein